MMNRRIADKVFLAVHFFEQLTMFERKAAPLSDRLRSFRAEKHVVHVWSQWNERASRFARQQEGAGATLFQSTLWLQTWYETFTPAPDTTAVIVGVEDAATGELLLLLPLCRRTQNGLSTICFPDFGLADYNAPILHVDFAPDKAQITRLMSDICAALPDADLLKLEKIPDLINKTKNPLIMLEGMHESNLCHFGVQTNGSWEAYWSGLKRNFRKDQRRRWRVLEKHGEVSFIWCRAPPDIGPLFETLVVQQQARLQRLDLPCLLDNRTMKSFYEKIIKAGCADGRVIFTALLVDGQPVATLCGFGDGDHYAMTLSGHETGKWGNCSPGRLLTERTMQVLHDEGYSYFDFTIGDEPYKKYFAMEQGCLYEFIRPLSLKAVPQYAWMKLKARQRKSQLARSLKNLIAK